MTFGHVHASSVSAWAAAEGAGWLQVHISASSSRGNFESYNNYVNFRPRNFTRDAEVFNVCAIAPQASPARIACQHLRIKEILPA